MNTNIIFNDILNIFKNETFINNLNSEDIEYLIFYLNEINNKKKISKDYLQNSINNFNSNKDKKFEQINNNYFNPYEYGSKQKQLPMLFYDNSKINVNDTKNCNNYDIKNIDIESNLKYNEINKENKNSYDNKYSRFNLLPFNPQDTKHIVWDNIPRGGHSTRNDKNNYY